MRVTKVLFWVSDICAWLLICLAVVLALTYFFGAPILAAMDHTPLSWTKAATMSFYSLLVAAGAYRLTRRKPLALFPVLIPAIAALINGALLSSLVALAFVLLVFGLPFLLAYIESRPHVAAKKEISKYRGQSE